MAAMASQPAMNSPRITIGTVRGNPRQTTLLLWVPASVVGAALGALLAFEIAGFGAWTNSNFDQAGIRYLATIASVALVAGAQWWVLRRARLDAYWWVPGTVAAQLLASILIIPTVLKLFLPTTPFQPFNPSLAQTMVAGGVALGAAGVLVGAAQALILRASAGDGAWWWILGTVVGEALAGSMTSAVSIHVLVLPIFVAVIAGAALGTLLISSSQLVVLIRLLR